MTTTQTEWPLWEVFVRSKQGLEHKHCGSLHAVDAVQALQMARDVYTRRQEGVSIWVVQSSAITASSLRSGPLNQLYKAKPAMPMTRTPTAPAEPPA